MLYRLNYIHRVRDRNLVSHRPDIKIPGRHNSIPLRLDSRQVLERRSRGFGRTSAPEKPVRFGGHSCYTGGVIELGSLLFRYFEAAVLGLLFVSTILIYLRRRPAGLVWFSAVAMSAIAVHLYLEEGRWQLLPAYALLFAFSIWLARPAGQPYRSARRYGAPGLVVRILVTLVVLPALALPALVPLFRVSPGSGPHPVGSARVLLETALQSEASAGSLESSLPAGNRWTIWYPAETASPVAASYWSADDLARHRLPGLPWLAATHLPLVPTAATLRAPILDERLPLLVVVPGADALPGDNLNVVLEAASAGWLVVRMPPSAGEELVLEAVSALDAGTRDAALADRVDAERLVLLSAGAEPTVELGVPTIRLRAGRLVEAHLPSGSLALEAPDAEVPAQALTTRYLMMRPARLLVGSSDVPPAALDRLVREAVRTLLADGSPNAPVFSARPPTLDELVARYDGVVLRRLPAESRRDASRR